WTDCGGDGYYRSVRRLEGQGERSADSDTRSMRYFGAPTILPATVSTEPGLEPVAWSESQTREPLTNTFSMPVGSSRGLWKVEWSMTVSGLKRTRSAKFPTLSVPRSFQPRRRAGSEVILRMASGRVSHFFSRT